MAVRGKIRVAAGTLLAAALVVGTAACGPDSGSGKSSAGDKPGTPVAPDANGAKTKDGAKNGGGVHIPSGIPTSIKDITAKDQNWNDWKDWARKNFQATRIPGHWSAKRLRDAKPTTIQAKKTRTNSAGASEPQGNGNTTTATPPPVHQAVAQPKPYAKNGYYGKLFFDTPNGPEQCSATVVTDPRHPGQSNLAWTAGHCVHGGQGKGWFRNMVFIPGYDGHGSTDQQIAPFGQWSVSYAGTSGTWMKQGAELETAAYAWDYAVIRVAPPRGVTTSLQQSVGRAVQPYFGTPVQGVDVRNYGYPVEGNFDGASLFSCSGKTTEVDSMGGVPMQWLGCTMTGGESGGGWIANIKGKNYLVGNNSLINRPDVTWVTSPHFGANAREVWESVANHG